MDSCKLLRVLKLRIIYGHKQQIPGSLDERLAGLGQVFVYMRRCQDSEVNFLMMYQQEGEKTSLCVLRFCTNSFVSCKTQHSVMEFRKIRPRGMEVATGLI